MDLKGSRSKIKIIRVVLIYMLKKLFLGIIFVFLINCVYADLKINEIMANPDPCSDSYCEWIELYNDNGSSVNVSGWNFSDDEGVDYFDSSYFGNDDIIIPGLYYAIIVDSDSRVQHNYEIDDSVVWIYVDSVLGSGGLKNTGETITIYDDESNSVDSLLYEEVDAGNSWALINGSWVESEATPGRNNTNNESFVSDYSVIKINEFLPDPVGNDNANMPDGEWVELYNSGDEDLDLLGFSFYDNYGEDADVFITNTSTDGDSIIESNDYLVVYMNGVSSFLNNDGYEKIKLHDIYDNLVDEVSYSGSDEGVSWSLNDNVWEKTVPTIGFGNEDNASSTESEINIEEIYDLGSDEKAEWGDIVRVKFFVYKGNTEKNVVWIWIENDEERITKKSKLHVFEKFQNMTLTYPIMIQDNCNEDFKDDVYKIVIEGLNAIDEENLEIRERPLCKDYKEKKPRAKSFEYEILTIPEEINEEDNFVVKVKLQNNEQEDVNVNLWSYAYSGKKKYVGEEMENLRNVKVKSKTEEIVKLDNRLIDIDDTKLYKFKVKVKREDRKNAFELRDEILVYEEKETLKNEKKGLDMITGNVIYESKGKKAERSSIFFISGVFMLLLVNQIWRKFHGIENKNHNRIVRKPKGTYRENYGERYGRVEKKEKYRNFKKRGF